MTPFAMQRSADGTVGMSAKDTRFTGNAVFAQSAPNRVYSGVIPEGTDPATGTPAGLIVTPSVPASNELQVSAGVFIVQSDTEQTSWRGGFEGISTVTVPPADTTNDRTDLAVVWVEDGKDSQMDVFTGPADGTMARPTGLPAASTVLASWTTPAGDTTTIPSVADERRFAVAVGGNRLVINGIGADDPATPGQMRGSLDTSDKTFSVDMFTGLGWVPVASKVTAWTPKFGSTNYDQIAFGSGGYAEGYYMQFVGGLTYVFGHMEMGSTSGDAGHGPITCTLPPGITPLISEVYIPCRFQNPYFVAPGFAYVSAARGNIQFGVPGDHDDCSLGFLRNADSGWGVGTGIPHWAGHFTIQAGANLEFSGLFLAQQ
ncbi:MAG: hypothetical protein ACRDMV_10925 [Streptosporangiales bacterium]